MVLSYKEIELYEFLWKIYRDYAHKISDWKLLQRATIQCGGAKDRMDNKESRNHSGEAVKVAFARYVQHGASLRRRRPSLLLLLPLPLLLCIDCAYVWLLFLQMWNESVGKLLSDRKLYRANDDCDYDDNNHSWVVFGSGCIGSKHYFMQRSYSCFFLYGATSCGKYRLYSSSFNRPK